MTVPIPFPIKVEGEKLFEADVQNMRKSFLLSGAEVVTSGGSSNDYELTIDRNADGGDNNQIIESADFTNGVMLKFRADRNSTGAVVVSVLYSDGGGGTIINDKKLYVDFSNQADSGHIISGEVYEIMYMEALDSAAGGFLMMKPIFNPDKVSLQAVTAISKGAVVSTLKEDPTKVEKTRLRFFQDGALGTVNTGFTDPIIVEISEVESLVVGLSGGNMQARVVYQQEDGSPAQRTQSGNIVAATTILHAAKVDDLTVVVLYENSGTESVIALQVDSGDRTTISNGTKQDLTSANFSTRADCFICQVTTNKFAVGYVDGTTQAYVVCGTVSSLAITLGTALSMASAPVATCNMRVLAPTATRIVVGYSVAASSGEARGVILSVSGTTLAITASANTATGSATTCLGLFLVNSTRALVMGSNTADGCLYLNFSADSTDDANDAPSGIAVNYAHKPIAVIPVASNFAYLYLQHDGTLICPNDGENTNSPTATIQSIGFSLTSDSQQYAVLRQGGTNNQIRVMTLVGGTVSLFEHGGNFTTLIGMADAAITGFSSGNITKKGRMTGLTSLTANKKYYLQKDGSLSTTLGFYLMGRAVSTTSLDIDIERVAFATNANQVITGGDPDTSSGAYWGTLFRIRDDWVSMQIASTRTTDVALSGNAYVSRNGPYSFVFANASNSGIGGSSDGGTDHEINENLHIYANSFYEYGFAILTDVSSYRLILQAC